MRINVIWRITKRTCELTLMHLKCVRARGVCSCINILLASVFESPDCKHMWFNETLSPPSGFNASAFVSVQTLKSFWIRQKWLTRNHSEHRHDRLMCKVTAVNHACVTWLSEDKWSDSFTNSSSALLIFHLRKKEMRNYILHKKRLFHGIHRFFRSVTIKWNTFQSHV